MFGKNKDLVTLFGGMRMAGAENFIKAVFNELAEFTKSMMQTTISPW